MSNGIQEFVADLANVSGSSSRSLTKPVQSVDELCNAITKFVTWLEHAGYESYDPYDISGTGYGKLARRLYYEKNVLGVLLTAPIVLTEILLPQLRAVLVRKDRYPTADAQLILAFLNLHEAGWQYANNWRSEQSSGHKWLFNAKDLAQDLVKHSVPNYSGYCWGYPFDWQNVNGLMPKDTPHITATPYCYEAFTRLYEVTGEECYLDVARSTMEFVLNDLNDTPIGDDAAASSYTPHDHGMVVNASAYRSFVLFDAGSRFHNENCFAKATRNLEFILQSQRADGSWLYAVDNPAEAFIDHFHTCFVLKNLCKINRYVQRDDVREALQRGYGYYRNALFDKNDTPKLFAIAPRKEMVELEMYNYAEDITLGCLLADEIPGALEFANELASRLIASYQLPAGYFVTRVYRGGIRHTVPFLRWPQSQLFLSLTNLLRADSTAMENQWKR